MNTEGHLCNSQLEAVRVFDIAGDSHRGLAGTGLEVEIQESVKRRPAILVSGVSTLRHICTEIRRSSLRDQGIRHMATAPHVNNKLT